MGAKVFGEEVKRWRELRNLTIKELAARSNMRVNRLQKIEAGNLGKTKPGDPNTPSDKEIDQLREALNLGPNGFIHYSMVTFEEISEGTLTAEEHARARVRAYFLALRRGGGTLPPYDYAQAVDDFCRAAGEVTIVSSPASTSPMSSGAS